MTRAGDITGFDDAEVMSSECVEDGCTASDTSETDASIETMQ